MPREAAIAQWRTCTEETDPADSPNRNAADDDVLDRLGNEVEVQPVVVHGCRP